MLQILNLCYDLPTRPLVRNFCLELCAGEVLHLQGPNGSGKTTILRMIAGMLMPESGSIKYASEITKTYIGAASGLSPVLSVTENYHLLTGCSIETLNTAIETAGLSSHANIWCGTLSSGQQKRASLIRLQLLPRNLWLLDEPFNTLDTDGISYLSKLINNHIKVGGAVIITSHQDIPSHIQCHQSKVIA